MTGYLTQNHALVQAFRSRSESRRDPRPGPDIFKMAPQLADYFREDTVLAAKGRLDRPISGLVMDSRRVVPGNLFFALPGRRADGASFVDEAVARGAVAVVTERMPSHPPAQVTFLQVADARATLARVARCFYDFPDRALEVVGVTGTNGKTTVAHLTKFFLETGGERAGLLGTVSYDLGARMVPSFKTTPESLDVFGMLAQMRTAGCRHAVMEVSSHGLDQRRVLGLQFAAAVFTNLTQDHLDYHQSLDAYFEVKTRLFTGATGSAPRVAVVNLDDPHGVRLTGLLPAHLRTVTFGESPRAQLRAENIVLGFKGATFRLVWPGGACEVVSPLLGRYNVSNVLAAAATAWALGRDPAAFLPRLATFTGVPGRMERVEAGQPFNVLVDYAHTDDALRNALGMLRPITPGRLLVVFGCGGNRDRRKRPLMVSAVQDFADHAFATADNPRNEPITQIFADMSVGVTAPEKITWVDDRRRALSVALDACRPGDSLLVAGKGHETYQEFADTIVPFDDRQVLRELIRLKSGAPPA
jgi:UDP-N-acetylmuramoyl-L-alanyl-D-glutamate--2,6-diaminopimelate ligase